MIFSGKIKDFLLLLVNKLYNIIYIELFIRLTYSQEVFMYIYQLLFITTPTFNLMLAQLLKKTHPEFKTVIRFIKTSSQNIFFYPEYNCFTINIIFKYNFLLRISTTGVPGTAVAVIRKEG